MSQRWEPWDPSRPPHVSRSDVVRAVGELLVLIALVVTFCVFALICGEPPS